MTSRPLPNTETESNEVLGCLLHIQDINKLKYYLREVEADWLHTAKHKTLYKAIEECSEKDEVASIISLGAILNDDMISFVMDVMSSVSTTSLIEQHIKKLKQKGIKRLSILATSQSIDEMYKKDFDVSIDFLIDRLTKLRSKLSSDLTRTTEDKVNTMIDEQIEAGSTEEDSVRQDITLGVNWLDNKMKIWRKQVVCLGARPAVGKTAFMLRIAYNQARFENLNVAVFIGESDAEELIRRICCMESGMDYYTAMNGFEGATHTQIDDFQNTALRIKEMKNFFVFGADEFNLSIHGIESCLIKTKVDFDCIHADYLQDFKPMGKDRNEKRRIFVSNNAREFKEICKRQNCAGFLLSQLNRSNDNKPPTQRDLKETSDIEQLVHVVLLLHNPNENKQFKHSEEKIVERWVYTGKTRLIKPFKINVAFEQESANFKGIYSGQF